MTSAVKHCFGRWWGLFLVLALLTGQALAQSIVTGDAVGTVTDPSGAVISDASVTLTSTDTGATQSVTTASNGFYRFSLLKPGKYELLVKQTGFKSISQSILVSVGQSVENLFKGDPVRPQFRGVD